MGALRGHENHPPKGSFLVGESHQIRPYLSLLNYLLLIQNDARISCPLFFWFGLFGSCDVFDSAQTQRETMRPGFFEGPIIDRILWLVICYPQRHSHCMQLVLDGHRCWTGHSDLQSATERKSNSLRRKYCWRLKSCTTWDVWNPINNGINYLSTGAGFQPSTVWKTRCCFYLIMTSIAIPEIHQVFDHEATGIGAYQDRIHWILGTALCLTPSGDAVLQRDAFPVLFSDQTKNSKISKISSLINDMEIPNICGKKDMYICIYIQWIYT